MYFECPPDLSPRDFHVFGPLKEVIGGKTFRSDDEMQQAVHEWLLSQLKEFFVSRDTHALPKLWDTCMERSAGYIEKRSHCVE
jgi:hypothetical protein